MDKILGPTQYFTLDKSLCVSTLTASFRDERMKPVLSTLKTWYENNKASCVEKCFVNYLSLLEDTSATVIRKNVKRGNSCHCFPVLVGLFFHLLFSKIMIKDTGNMAFTD